MQALQFDDGPMFRFVHCVKFVEKETRKRNRGDRRINGTKEESLAEKEQRIRKEIKRRGRTIVRES